MNKKEKKNMISEHIDLANGRYKDDEVDTLYDLTTNQQKYSGQSKSVKNKFTSWSSDGKYTREEETTCSRTRKTAKIDAQNCKTGNKDGTKPPYCPFYCMLCVFARAWRFRLLMLH